MAVPLGAPNFREGLRYVAETFHVLKGILKDRGLAILISVEELNGKQGKVAWWVLSKVFRSPGGFLVSAVLFELS